MSHDPSENDKATRRHTVGESLTLKELTETRRLFKDLIAVGKDYAQRERSATDLKMKTNVAFFRDEFLATLRICELFLGVAVVLIVPSALLFW